MSELIPDLTPEEERSVRIIAMQMGVQPTNIRTTVIGSLMASMITLTKEVNNFRIQAGLEPYETKSPESTFHSFLGKFRR